MQQKFVAASVIATVLASAASTPASATGPHLWDGVAVVSGMTNKCAPTFNLRAGGNETVYIPKIQAGDLNSVLSFQNNELGTGVGLRAAQATSQFNGSGTYNGSGIFDFSLATVTWSGTYQLTVTPSPITASTTVVHISGKITNYANIAGCTLTIRSIFMPWAS